MSVTIEWVAQACFRVWRDGGPVIVMDPYTPKRFGLPENQTIKGDTLIVSSMEDVGHSYPQLVQGNPQIINALDLVVHGLTAEIDGSPVIAVGAAESPTHESGAPKANALYALQVGGLWVMHMGDLGYGLSPQEMAPFVGRCDVLLAIVGQTNTLSLEDLDLMIDHLEPRWIVPMHYRAWWPTKMRPLSEFLDRRPRDPLIYPRSSMVTLPLETPRMGQPTIVVLQPGSCPDGFDFERRCHGHGDPQPPITAT